MSALLQIGLVNAAVATVLACLAALIGRKVRRPALVHALWLVVLMKLVTPPVFELPIIPLPEALRVVSQEKNADATSSNAHSAVSKAARDRNPQSASATNSSGEHFAAAMTDSDAGRPSAASMILSRLAESFTAASANWRPWLWRNGAAIIGWIWIGGALVWFLRQAVTALKFSQRLALATPAPAELQRQADELAGAMGLAHRPPVMFVRDVISPMLWGIGRRARLLFPVNLLSRLEEGSRETLIAHELAHYRRGDHWVRAFELVVSGLFWWHPIVWWARREIEIAEEECCDAWVIEQFPETPRWYAEALLATIDFLSESQSALALPPAAAGLGHVPLLRRRLTAIMRGVAPKAMSGPGRLAVFFAAVALLPWQPGLTVAQARPAAHSLSPLVMDAIDADAAALADAESSTAEMLAGLSHSLVRSMSIESGYEPAVVQADVPWATAKSPDGKYLITRRGKENVFLYDTQSGQSVDLSEHHILTVVFSPDGRRFATGGNDGTVRLWDSSTATVQFTFHHGREISVQSVAFAHDGKVLVSASRDGTLKLWNLEFGGELAARESRALPVNCLVVSPDGRWLAVGSGSWKTGDAGHVVIWDLATLREHALFECASPVGAIDFRDGAEFGEDGQALVAGDFKGALTVWSFADQRLIGKTGRNLRLKDAVNALRFSPDTKALIQFDLAELLRTVPFQTPDLELLIPTFDAAAGVEPLSVELPYALVRVREGADFQRSRQRAEPHQRDEIR